MTASNDQDSDTGLSGREDAALERLYRKGGPRSPTALDEAVLARAAESLMATKRHRLQRLRVWSLAATLTLVTGLVWQLRDTAIPTAPSRAAAQPETVARTQSQAANVATPSDAPAAETQSVAGPATQDRRADVGTRQTAPAPARAKAEQMPALAQTNPPRGDNKAAAPSVSATEAGGAKDLTQSPAPAGAIVRDAEAQASARSAAPAAIRAEEASAPYQPGIATIAAPTPNQELQQMLYLIRSLSADSSFISTATSEDLAPGAFADRMAAKSTPEALLKEAANWQLKRPDGKLVAADQWLREQTGKTVR